MEKMKKMGMPGGRLLLVWMICIFLIPCGAAGGFQNAFGEQGSILLRLGHEHFDPLMRYPERTQAALPLKMKSVRPEEKGYFIVQFDGPVQKEWKEQLSEKSAEFLDYLPDFAFIVRIGLENEAVIRTLPHVRWLGPYLPFYKFSRRLMVNTLENQSNSDSGEQKDKKSSVLRIVIFPGEDIETVKSIVISFGATVLRESIKAGRDISLTVEMPSDKIGGLGAIPAIKWIAPAPQWQLLNNVSTDILSVCGIRQNHQLYGEGQTVAVCDTGLDRGLPDAAALHRDFLDGSGQSRVLRVFDLSGKGKIVPDYHGHGTHVAGSVLGNGALSGSDPGQNDYPETSFAGMAPKAKLIFQAQAGIENNCWPTLGEIFWQAQAAGADIHTNSWGAANGSSYNDECRNLDDYVWNNRDFLVLFAAGNSGVDKDGDGVIDLYSLDVPGTAKNCLTVGASEGFRPYGCGYDENWGQAWPFCFSAYPVSFDHLSNNAAGMAGFSSRGPSIDGRYKPDLVAPGTNILSTRSSVALKSGWGIYDSNYLWMGGTSMSTPLTAGTAALVREYLNREIKIAKPSAALLKAAVINGAQDISPGQYGTGAGQEIPDSPVPNNIEGWGRINLAETVYPQSYRNILYYDEAAAISTGELSEHRFAVVDPDYPLKINVVWSDYPGSEVTQGGLVNDLDVCLISPSAQIYYPNNAVKKPSVSILGYADQESLDGHTSDSMAVRFTPSFYPVKLETMLFIFYNPLNKFSGMSVLVYDDNGPGNSPGRELFRKEFRYVPPGDGDKEDPSVVTVGIEGVVINDGDFYIAVENADPDQYISTAAGNSFQRAYKQEGSNWVLAENTAHIFASIRGMEFSTSFDRVNNVLGITLPKPESGAYRLQISGYNVPYGPQSYALVVSGAVSDADLEAGALQFASAEYRICEDGGSAIITVERAGGASGELQVDFRTEDGTAKEGTDYQSVTGTFSWKDGEGEPKTFSVPIYNDNIVEANETVTLILRKSSVNNWLNSVKTAILTIEDCGTSGEGDGSSRSCFIDSVSW